VFWGFFRFVLSYSLSSLIIFGVWCWSIVLFNVDFDFDSFSYALSYSTVIFKKGGRQKAQPSKKKNREMKRKQKKLDRLQRQRERR
jgi:hypothetical protein